MYSVYNGGPSANNGYFSVCETFPNYVLLKEANSNEHRFFGFCCSLGMGNNFCGV